MVISRNQANDATYSKVGILVGFLCAYVPLAISAFIRRNVAILISLVTSVYTPYLIIIVPG